MVEEAFDRKAVPVETPACRPQDYYGELVFNRSTMFKYLPKETYDALIDAIENKKPIERTVADVVAQGMRQWAIDHGARHYTHWFAPLTGGRPRRMMHLSSTTAKVELSKSSPANCLCSRSQMPPVSPTAEYATHSKHVGIPHGIFRLLRSYSTRHYVFPQYSFHTQANRLTTKPRFCEH